MNISILICSRSRRKELENLVELLNKTVSNHNYEIVVVEETETTSAIEGALYISHPVENKGIPYARNLALKHASGEIVVFLDDDCQLKENWLDRLIAPFSDKMVIGVQGGVTAPGHTNAIGWAESILGFPGGGIRRIIDAENQKQETREISTLNCAYRKWVLDEVGGFDARLKFGGEDYVLAKQVCKHGKCLFVPEALVTHASRGSLLNIFKWFVRRGRADIDVIRMGEQKNRSFPMLFLESISFKILIVFFLCMLLFRFATIIIGIFIFCFATLQYTRYFKTWKESAAPFFTLAYIPIVKIVMDIGMDWGRIRRILFG